MHRTDTTYGLQTCRRLGFAAIMLFLALPMHILHAAGAEQDTADEVMKILKSEALENTVTGVLVISAGGDTLVACNPDKNMVPASNLKLVTTGTAMDFLGSGYRFRTSLAYSGHITGGVLHGDLYIIGGGDPTLAADDSIALPAEAVFSQWKSYVEKAGISKIEGRIIGDSRYFDSVAEEDTWVWNDIGTYYGTGTSGLSFYENKKDFLVEAGENEGDPVNVVPGFPDTPWMTLDFPCTTGAAGTGNKLYYYTTAFAPYGEMRGTFAVDRGKHTEEVSNKFPAYTCAWHFSEYLKSCGIVCSEGAADTGELSGAWHAEEKRKGYLIPAREDSLTGLGETFSPELRRIVSETNRESNNFYAETIFKTLGKEYCGKGSFAGGRAAVRSILSRMGVSVSNVKIQDGSGLSRQNYVSPSFLCSFLLAMLDSPAYEDFLKSLPSPGEDGTLSYMMKKYPAGLKSRIRMKSGSMDGTLCYSGYILPESSDGCRGKTVNPDGVIVFSIMTNNSTSSAYRVRLALEKIIASIASGDAASRQATASRKDSGTGR